MAESRNNPGSSEVSITAVVGELLALDSVVAVEERARRAFVESTGAGWAVFYRAAGAQYRRSSVGPAPPEDVPDAFDSAAVLSALDRCGGLSQTSTDEPFPPETHRAVLESDVGSEPSLLLIGPPVTGVSSARDFEALEILTVAVAAALRNAALIEQLRSQVFIDFVTGCYNRRAFNEHLKVEMVRARRYERPLTLILMDLDEFKRVNDDLGHPAGDEALQRVGETLRAAFRTTDRVCRYGGDEFAVIFPETSKEDVYRLAERLRRQVAAIFPEGEIVARVTASIGIASFPVDGMRADDLVRAADRALYNAKAGGRNRVVAA